MGSYSEKKKFQKIGDIVILNKPVGKDIAKTLLKELGVKTVCVRGLILGDLKKPQVKILAGNSTETIHKENGCLYKLDVAKVMFSKGNVKERHRPSQLVKPREVIVDMFCGIGYFSIPIAKTCPNCRVYSIELNPDAIHYLKENIKLNKLSNIQVLEGDCRAVSIPEKADRIIMGYLPRTAKFLQAAFGFLKKKGIIHFHNTYREDELWDKPLKTLKKEARKAGFKLEKILYNEKVKQYAPRVQHVVIDAQFSSS